MSSSQLIRWSGLAAVDHPVALAAKFWIYMKLRPPKRRKGAAFASVVEVIEMYRLAFGQ